MNPLVLIIFSVLIAVVVVGMVAALVISNRKAIKDRQMAVIMGKNAVPKGEKTKKDAQNKRRDEIARKLKETSSEEDDEEKKARLSDLLMQAGMDISVKQYFLFSFLFAVGITLVAKMLGQSGFVLLMVFITGFLGLPKWFVKRKIKKRQKKFLEEFSDALEAMVRLLRSGMPVSEAIAMAGKEFTGPVGEEMNRIYDAQKIGVTLPEAARDACRRMPLTEMQMFATGVSIQAQTGASLSDVLMNLSGVIRARFRLKRKIQALSQEAKSSAAIIGALPFLVGGGLFAVNPEYMDIMLNTMAGRLLLLLGAFWMACGIFVMKIMINFKI